MNYCKLINTIALERNSVIRYSTADDFICYYPFSIIQGDDSIEVFVSSRDGHNNPVAELHFRFYVSERLAEKQSVILSYGCARKVLYQGESSFPVKSKRGNGYVFRVHATVSLLAFQEMLAERMIYFEHNGDKRELIIDADVMNLLLFLAYSFGINQLSDNNSELLKTELKEISEQKEKKEKEQREKEQKEKEQREKEQREKEQREREEQREKELREEEERREKEQREQRKKEERDLQLRPYAKALTKYILFRYRHYQDEYYHYLDSWHIEKYLPQFKDKDKDFEYEVIWLLEDRKILLHDKVNTALCDRCRLKQLYDIIDKNITADEVINNTKPHGCYIATSIYGSYDCPEVWTLRRFRDQVLSKTWYGRTFIKIYYAISPTMVKWFGDANWFQAKGRVMLDKVVKRLRISGFDNTPYIDL